MPVRVRTFQSEFFQRRAPVRIAARRGRGCPRAVVSLRPVVVEDDEERLIVASDREWWTRDVMYSL